jgi:hypothetical protein
MQKKSRKEEEEAIRRRAEMDLMLEEETIKRQ